MITPCDGAKSEKLELNGGDPNEADEEARESGWTENVTEEPPEMKLRGKKAKSCDLDIGRRTAAQRETAGPVFQAWQVCSKWF